MRSFRSLDQPRQFVYTLQPHMSFLSPRQQRSQWRHPSQWPPSVPASDHRTHTHKPKKKKKKKTQRDPSATSTHQSPKPTDQHFAAADTIFTFNHRRWERRPPLIPVAATPLRFQPPLSSPSSRRHSRWSPQPSIPSAAVFTEPLFSLEDVVPLISLVSFFCIKSVLLVCVFKFIVCFL